MTITGCKLELNNLLNKDEISEPTKAIDETSATIEPTEEKTFATEPIETTEEIEETIDIPIIDIFLPTPKEQQVPATTNINIRSSNTTESLKIG